MTIMEAPRVTARANGAHIILTLEPKFDGTDWKIYDDDEEVLWMKAFDIAKSYRGRPLTRETLEVCRREYQQLVDAYFVAQRIRP